MPLIGESDLKELGCKEPFVPLVNENLGVIPIYHKVTELMYGMIGDYSVQDVFRSLLEITRYIEIEALTDLTLANLRWQGEFTHTCSGTWLSGF